MAAVFVIVGLAALVWGAIFMLRASLVDGCLVWLAAAACFGYPFWRFEAGPVPLTIDRLAIVALAVMFVVQRSRGLTQTRGFGAAEWWLVALIALLTASTFAAGWRSAPVGQTAPIWRLLWGYLLPTALYFTARASSLRTREGTTVLAALACFGVYLSVTGILEALQQWRLLFPSHIADPNVGIHFGRARGPMVQSCLLGMFLGVGLISAYLWLPRYGRRGWILLAVIAPLHMAAAYFTYTRAVWLAMASAMAVAALVTLEGRQRWILVGGLSLAGVAALASRWENFVAFRRDTNAAGTRESAEVRLDFVYLSWLMFQDRPVLGAGFGQFPEAKLPYLSDRSSSLRLERVRKMYHHNTFLSLLAETGAVGLGLFLAAMAAWLHNAWRLWRARGAPQSIRILGPLLIGAMACYFWMLVSYEVSYTALESSLVFVIAGTVSAACGEYLPVRATESPALCAATSWRVSATGV